MAGEDDDLAGRLFWPTGASPVAVLIRLWMAVAIQLVGHHIDNLSVALNALHLHFVPE